MVFHEMNQPLVWDFTMKFWEQAIRRMTSGGEQARDDTMKYIKGLSKEA
jgi:hypothetical protein